MRRTIVNIRVRFLGKAERDTHLFMWMQKLYIILLRQALAHKPITVIIASITFAVTMALVPRIGTAFLPELQEGAIAINAVRLPNASLEGSMAVGTFIGKELGNSSLPAPIGPLFVVQTSALKRPSTKRTVTGSPALASIGESTLSWSDQSRPIPPRRIH